MNGWTRYAVVKSERYASVRIDLHMLERTCTRENRTFFCSLHMRLTCPVQTVCSESRLLPNSSNRSSIIYLDVY